MADKMYWSEPRVYREPGTYRLKPRVRRDGTIDWDAEGKRLERAVRLYEMNPPPMFGLRLVDPWRAALPPREDTSDARG